MYSVDKFLKWWLMAADSLLNLLAYLIRTFFIKLCSENSMESVCIAVVIKRKSRWRQSPRGPFNFFENLYGWFYTQHAGVLKLIKTCARGIWTAPWNFSVIMIYFLAYPLKYVWRTPRMLCLKYELIRIHQKLAFYVNWAT